MRTLLAISSVGAAIEFAWASGETCIVPFLLQFWPSSVTGLVFIANPLVSFWLQPLFGHLADTSTCTLGRRRPFIIALTTSALLGVACFCFARDIGGSDAVAVPWVAFVGYTLSDASHDLLEAPSRALLEDLCPPWQQHRGMALYTTVAMLGRLGALMLGSMPTLPFIGGPDAHMRMLLLASGAMLILCATACVYAAR